MSSMPQRSLDDIYQIAPPAAYNRLKGFRERVPPRSYEVEKNIYQVWDMGQGERAALFLPSGMGYGEAKIRDELYRRGVPRELWEDALSKSPDAQEAIARVIAQKTKGRALDEKGRKRLSDMLLRRGFAWRDVRAAIAQISENATEFDYEE